MLAVGWVGKWQLHWHHAGAEVVLASRKTESLNTVASTINSNQNKSIALKMDITNFKEINETIEHVLDIMGSIDILVNNAGIEGNREFLDITPEYLDAIIDVNLKGHIYITQRVGKFMKEKKAGKIINISSIMGIIGLSKGIPYSISKFGMLGFTKSSCA